MKYYNNGNYCKEKIDRILDEWCEVSNFDRRKVSHFTPEFLDDVWELSWEIATGDSVKCFLMNAWDERQESGYFRQFQACCLLKTYLTLLKEVQKAELYGRYNGKHKT